jgi:WD40 repeat protein/transcriptional regulator with XRE-family HTH domain
MPRASRSWRVHKDYIDLVKKLTVQKFGRQQDLAENLDVARCTVSKYLNGRLVDIYWFKEISFLLDLNDGREIADLPQEGFAPAAVAPPPEMVTQLIKERQRQSLTSQRQDWGEINSITTFYGRSEEIIFLHKLVLESRCQVLALLGMGGIGKTTLAHKLVEQIQDQFEYMIWRSLRSAPPLTETLAAILKFIIPDPGFQPPIANSEKISCLIEHLRTARCLIVFDNVESILADSTTDVTNQRAGYYRAGYEDYGELIKQMGESAHQSCLILTSREKPKEVAALEQPNSIKRSMVRSMVLNGLESSAAQNIVQTRSITGTVDEFERLITICAGNPLVLQIVASNIQELFAGDLAEFLAADTIFFGQIGELLDEQFNRLLPLEKHIMFWLAINQEPTSIAELVADIAPFTTKRELLEAIESLSRRPFLEKHNNLFSQQPVVMEYITERLITQVCQEIVTGEPSLLMSHALLKAKAKDHIRESQTRQILSPIIEHLTIHFKTIDQTVKQLQKMLVDLQQPALPMLGYAAGNLINLLCQLRVDLTGWDFSHLALWQTYLCDVNLHRVNFTNANLEGAVFKETFGGILSVDISSDGKLLVTGGTDGSVRLWQVANGKQLWVNQEHHSWVFSVVFNYDCSQIASGSSDSTIRLWNVTTGESLNCLRDLCSEINTIAFSPTSQMLIIGGSEPQAKLVDTRNGQLLHKLHGHTGSRVLAVAFSPNGQMVITGSTDHTLKLWDVQTGECLRTFYGHDNGVRSLTFSPNGKTIASGSIDHTIKLWHVDREPCWQTLSGHQAMILDLAFSPDGSVLTSAGLDRTLRLWQVNTGQCLRVLSGHTKPVWSMVYTPDGTTIISGGDDHTVRFWEAETGFCTKTWQGNSNAMTAVTYPAPINISDQPAASTPLLASGSEDGHIRLWDINNGNCCHTLAGHKGRVISLQHSPDGKSLLSGSWDGTAKLWDLEAGKCSQTFYGHTLLIWSIAFSSDGRTVASASEDGTIRLWDINGNCRQVFTEHQGAVHTIAFSPDGQTLASGGIDGTLRIWNALAGQPKSIKSIKGHTSPVRNITFSNDGRNLISTSQDSTIKIWNLHTGKCERILEGHYAAVWSIALNMDDCVLASGGEDKVIKLWSLASGECLKTLTGHQNMIVSMVFYPENSWLISCSLDETIKIWDQQTGKCLSTLRVERPYEGMNITGANGLTKAQIDTLKALGAVAI